MSTYLRCTYVPDGGIQCDNWVKVEVETDSLTKCPLHLNHISPLLKQENKQTYIDIRNDAAKLCHDMSLDELELHIAGLELVIEQERAKLMSARSVKGDKLDKLSEEEREVRRKIKTERKEKPETTKRVTIKSDPIKFFMQTYNISEIEAMKKLGLSD